MYGTYHLQLCKRWVFGIYTGKTHIYHFPLMSRKNKNSDKDGARTKTYPALVLARSANMFSFPNMLVLRAKADRGWVLTHAADSFGPLFFRYLQK